MTWKTVNAALKRQTFGSCKSQKRQTDSVAESVFFVRVTFVLAFAFFCEAVSSVPHALSTGPGSKASNSGMRNSQGTKAKAQPKFKRKMSTALRQKRHGVIALPFCASDGRVPLPRKILLRKRGSAWLASFCTNLAGLPCCNRRYLSPSRSGCQEQSLPFPLGRHGKIPSPSPAGGC